MEFTTLRCWLKQLIPDELDEHSRQLLDNCFPDFNDQHDVANRLNADELAFVVGAKGTLPTHLGRLRRFAGPGLPRGRYSSICQDSSGDDGGTLVWELMSYWTANATLFPELIDSTVHHDAARALRENYPSIVGAAPFLLIKASQIEGLTSDESKPTIVLGTSIAKVLPLHIVQVEIDRVVDLRLQTTQDWFADFFGRLETEKGRAGNNGLRIWKEAPSGFREILPTLMTPSIGGTSFHQAVGSWLRTNKANGLVFPSARRDVHSQDRNGLVEKSEGWNFVLYHRAGPAGPENLFGLLPKWLSEEDTGLSIVEWEDGETRRSFAVAGAEAGERKRYDLEWKRRLECAQCPITGDIRFDSRGI